MKKYKGAKWLGKTEIVIASTGQVLKQGDICETIPEWEAKDRRGFEPVYDGFEKKKKGEIKDEL